MEDNCIRTISLNIPTPVGIWDYMMFSSGHVNSYMINAKEYYCNLIQISRTDIYTFLETDRKRYLTTFFMIKIYWYNEKRI